MVKSIKTYWWKGEGFHNLGDEITQLVLKKIYGISAEWAPPKKANLLSTGSTLGWIRPDTDSNTGHRQHVVGSGFMYATENLSNTDALEIHSVRGHLSRQKIEKGDLRKIGIGDPGLLAPEIATISNSTGSEKVALVPHHKNVENPSFIEKFEHLTPKVLDTRTTNLSEFLSAMASCDYVISQSLHGLVFADSLGIPNIWYKPGTSISSRDFKYFDYFSTVGRDFDSGITTPPKTVHEVQRHAHVVEPFRITRLQTGVRLAFDKAIQELHSR